MKRSVGDVLIFAPGSRYGLPSLNEVSARIRPARVGFFPALYMARTNVYPLAKP